MSDRLSHILKILAFITASILIALALYFVFFNGPTLVVTPGVPTETPSGTLPSSGTGAPTGIPTTPGGTSSTTTGTLPPSEIAKGGKTFTTLLTNTAVIGEKITTDGSIAYYDPKDGKFYTVDAKGSVIAMSQVTFPQASNVTFDPQATTAIIEFPDGSNVIYDFDKAKQTTLPPHWQEFEFSGNGSQIVAKSMGNDASNRALVITNADGSSTSVVADLGDNASKVDISWSPNNSVLAFSRTGTNTGGPFGRQEIYLIGPDGGASGALFVDGSSFKNIWAPDGTHLLYSVADPNNGYKAALWYADSRGDRAGESRRRFGIETLVDKCTFLDIKTVYCAVPRTMPTGGGSDVSLITSYDDVYKLDITTGNAHLIAVPAADTKIFSPSISPDGSNFYYSDSVGRINIIRLK